MSEPTIEEIAQGIVSKWPTNPALKKRTWLENDIVEALRTERSKREKVEREFPLDNAYKNMMEKERLTLRSCLQKARLALEQGCDLIEIEYCSHDIHHGDNNECYARELHKAITSIDDVLGKEQNK